MSYKLVFAPEAEEDLEYHRKSGDKAVKNKLNKFFAELTEHPQSGTGKPEQLKHRRSGYWSRRITQEHRLVYKIDEENLSVIILYLRDHYK